MNRFRQGFHYSFFGLEWGEAPFYKTAGYTEDEVRWVEDKYSYEKTDGEDADNKSGGALYGTSLNLDPSMLNELTVVAETKDSLKTLEKAVAQMVNPDENLIATGMDQDNTSTATAIANSNDKIWTKIESKEKDNQDLDKELEKQLVNLAKNKNIDFAWTNNEWKCSREEKNLAISSVKVFVESLTKETVQGEPSFKQIFKMCKDHMNTGKTELTKDEAKIRKSQLGINSKEGDIQNFYKAFLERQSRDPKYMHLNGLMWFIEKVENRDDLVKKLKTERSQKIEKKEKNERKKQNKGLKGKVDKKTWDEMARFEIIKKRTESIKNPTERMLSLLCDFNFDWEVNTWDVWYRTWTQFAEVFRNTLAMNELTKGKAVANLAAYAEKMWIDDIGKVTTVEDLYDWMTAGGYNQGGDYNKKSWYNRTKQLQYLIQNSAADFDDILINWANAGDKTLRSMMRAEKINDQVESKLRNKATELTKKLGEQMNTLGISEDKKAKTMAHIEQQLVPALRECVYSWGWWAAVGAQLKLLEWISATFNIWWGDKGPIFWAGIMLDGSRNIWENARIGASGYGGTNLLFIPCFNVWAEFWYDVKSWKRKQSLNVQWVSEITLWANVWVVGPVPTRWLAVWYDTNKKWWIEKEEKSIHDIIETQAYGWISLLGKITGETPQKQEENRILWLKDILGKQFKDSSDSELDAATNNLWRILKTFPFENTTETHIYAKVVADVFTDQWRNNNIIGITDNKRKITWWRLWIQFFAWLIPAPSAVLKFTRYRNARTIESDNSKARIVDAKVNWRWNELVPLEWKYLMEKDVKALNDILKQFWVKKEIRYDGIKQQTINGDPVWEPRILIPASIWNEINVRVSEELKHCVTIYSQEKEPNGDIYYSFPANATYRILTDTWWNKKWAILNIGNQFNQDTDVDIRDFDKMKEYIWENKLVQGKKYPENLKYEDTRFNGDVYKRSEVLDKLFNNNSEIVRIIQTIDSSDWKKFSAFVKTKRDGTKDFEDQIRALIPILEKRPQLKPIIEELKSDKTLDYEKQLIVDRVLALSARVDNIKVQKDLERLWNPKNKIGRREKYKDPKMIWPNGLPIFNKLTEKDYRREILPDIKNYTSVSLPNVIWATAFYHKNNESQWLALTWLRSTTAFGWAVKLLEKNDAARAKEWFLWEGDTHWSLDREKSPMEWKNVQYSLINYIEQYIGPIEEDAQKTKLSHDATKSLLKWEPVELKGKDWEEFKITLDVKYIFYLMWECANESIGMQLWGVKIAKKVDDPRQWEMYSNFITTANFVDNTADNRVFGFGWGFGKDQWGGRWETWQQWKIENWSGTKGGSSTWTWGSTWWMTRE